MEETGQGRAGQDRTEGETGQEGTGRSKTGKSTEEEGRQAVKTLAGGKDEVATSHHGV